MQISNNISSYGKISYPNYWFNSHVAMMLPFTSANNFPGSCQPWDDKPTKQSRIEALQSPRVRGYGGLKKDNYGSSKIPRNSTKARFDHSYSLHVWSICSCPCYRVGYKIFLASRFACREIFEPSDIHLEDVCNYKCIARLLSYALMGIVVIVTRKLRGTRIRPYLLNVIDNTLTCILWFSLVLGRMEINAWFWFTTVKTNRKDLRKSGKWDYVYCSRDNIVVVKNYCVKDNNYFSHRDVYFDDIKTVLSAQCLIRSLFVQNSRVMDLKTIVPSMDEQK